MTRPTGIPREFYDDAIRQRDAALERARVAEDRHAKLVEEMVALKRHDVGAMPALGMDPDLLNPEHGLGPKTASAIDEFAGGDLELRGILVARAHVLTAEAKMEGPDEPPDVTDSYVAYQIRQGDTN